MPYMPYFGVLSQTHTPVLYFSNYNEYSEDPLIYDYFYESSDVFSYFEGNASAWLLAYSYFPSRYSSGDYICVYDTNVLIWYIVMVDEV